MNYPIRKKAKKLSVILMLVYFASYVTRINFAVMIVKICSEMSMAKSELAFVITGLTICYGTGQVISGILGDKINPRLLLALGLATATAANILITLCRAVPAMTVVWCINGFAQSMLWPPIVRIMSTSLNDIEYSYTSVRVMWGSSAATLLLYLVCPILLPFMSWKVIMLMCAGVGAAALLLWLSQSPSLFSECNTKKEEKKGSSAELPATVSAPRYSLFPIFLIILGIILQGLLRDGVTNWMPSYMCEAFALSEESAIITAVIPAILSMLSFGLFDFIYRRVFKDEVTSAGFFFVAAVLSSAALYAVNALISSPVLSAILLAMLIALMHGINLMLISIVPKRFVKSGKVSTYSGVLNACTYIGASISNYGFALLAETKGWGFTILSWIFVSALGAAVCFAAMPLWRKFKREYSDT